jgi:hypothetical protein
MQNIPVLIIFRILIFTFVERRRGKSYELNGSTYSPNLICCLFLREWCHVVLKCFFNFTTFSKYLLGTLKIYYDFVLLSGDEEWTYMFAYFVCFICTLFYKDTVILTFECLPLPGDGFFEECCEDRATRYHLIFVFFYFLPSVSPTWHPSELLREERH